METHTVIGNDCYFGKVPKFREKRCGAPMNEARILVLDDEISICEICSRSLNRYGYDVVTTTSPKQALQMLREKDFDLLLLDVRMPEMDGIEVMRRVRTFAPELAIVVMTGYASLEAAIEAVKQGASDFLQKPFQLEPLRLAVSGALARRDLAHERARSQALMHLVQVSEQLASSLDMGELIQSALYAAMAETGAQRGSVMLYEPKGEVLRLEGAVGLPQEVPLGYAVTANEGVVGHVLRCGQALLVEDVGRDARLMGLSLVRKNQYDNPSFLSVPIRAGGHTLGVLNLSEKVGGIPFQSSDLEVAGLLCNQLAIALEKARLFDEIQESYQRLQQVDRLKSEFINIAAHELRTPLSIILGYALMLREELQGSLQEHMAEIVDSSLQLSRLVDDMTNLRYLEAGEVPLVAHVLYLQEVIPAVVGRFDQMVQSKEQTVVSEISESLPSVMADREKVELILSNLLSNAHKFTPTGGVIRIRVQLLEAEVLIVVEDTGDGIPAEEWEHIFEPFYQVEDSLRREHGGMGLGLSIARELVLLHGGRIWVESQVGQGSEFFFTLPCSDGDSS
jgi:signal transduction histidine kinase/CheY-like chemotaxis protein